MMQKRLQKIMGGFFRIGRILCRVQKIMLGILFWVIVLMVCVIALKNLPSGIPDKAALVIDPAGNIVEQLSGNPLNMVKSIGGKEVLLKDLLDAINKAKDDKRIQAIVLKTDNMDALGDVGVTKLLDLKSALEKFKQSGKKVIAFGNEYYQDRYFLAAQADEIYIDPLGAVFLEGLSFFKRFYKDGLDKLDVDINVFRVGQYKSAVEPYLRNGMSENVKHANLELLDDLWSVWLKECAAGRGLSVEDLRKYISRYKDSTIESRGDTAKIALDAKLVDGIANGEEIRKHLIELVGENKKDHSYSQIGFKSYLKAARKEPPIDNSKENVIGIVVAKGEIFNGKRPPGEIGGDSTAELIRKTRFDKSIKAIVLRVDSPGGSAYASEVIRRELEMARNEGKKVVISMGGRAASGGYAISLASDEIWASPATITGSIGVFGILPTYDKALSKYLGVNVDGVGTTPLSGIMRMDRPLNPAVGTIYQQVINRIYEIFITRVSEARGMEKEAVDAIAQGRIWSGEDAQRIGLVDRLGDLQDAIASAASLSGLGGDYQVKYIAPDLTQSKKMIKSIGAKIYSAIEAKGIVQNRRDFLLETIQDMVKEVDSVTRFNDPNGVYAYCPFYQ